MSRGVLILLIIAVGLGLYLWLVEQPTEKRHAEADAAAKRLVSFKEEDVQGFTLHSAGGDLEVARESDGQWIVTRPKRLEADRQAVEGFLRALVLAKVSRVVDESGADLQSYGLASPSVTVSVRLASGTQTFRFGDPGPLSSTLYAVREGEAKILLTSLSGADLQAKSLQEFRRKRVLQFDPNKVNRLKVATRTEEVVLYKEGHGEKSEWKIKAPVEAAADQPEVRSLLFGLEDLKAQAFVDDPKERQQKKAALGRPLATFTLHEGEADRTVSLYEDSKKQAAYAETTPQEPLYLVPPVSAKELAKGLFALRNKQLVAAEPEQVKTVVIKTGDQEYTVTHEGKEWLIDGDPRQKADPGRMNVFVSRVVRLQAERSATDKPGDLKAYGLDRPAAELIAADNQGKVLGRIAVGRQQEGLAYAQGSALPGVFQIRPDILNEIPKKAELLAAGTAAQSTTGAPR